VLDTIVKNGITLWKKAKKIIPGGSQLLSKQSEQFLPGGWPSYYKKAKGVEIWDLDGNKFTDMSYMGIGTCNLGYADDDVNNAVIDSIQKGNMTTLNCPEEVELAELLLKLNKWADMVRFARTGGEAMTVAVRIARAYTRKDNVAFCGYHGWHDWYLSANLANKQNLDELLLPGLDPNGVPRNLVNTALPFNYNSIDELESILINHEIGTIVVEPVRHQQPRDNFLEKVRKIAHQNDAILIFDEITSGWRMNVGGIHELYGVFPDIVVYGKAMSNGFPMSAIVGKKEVMDAAQTSFISSTYWTDRVGPTAGLATINKMLEKNVPQHLCKIGNHIGKGWKQLADGAGLDIEIMDAIPPLVTFKFLSEFSQCLHTLYTQEMLDRGYLASKSVYVSFAHDEQCIERYLHNVGEVFTLLSKAMEKNQLGEKLRGPIAHSGFKRLTDP
jgi:glutamate-1-semialdehyde aminotransferase